MMAATIWEYASGEARQATVPTAAHRTDKDNLKKGGGREIDTGLEGEEIALVGLGCAHWRYTLSPCGTLLERDKVCVVSGGCTYLDLQYLPNPHKR